MLHFLQPLWLWAIAGTLVPILIHLWKVKEGKFLKVGSLQLLGASPEKSSRRIQLNELLLLIIRCFIIILVAFFLASPKWIFANRKLADNGWILIYPANSKLAYQQYHNEIDSLVNAGYIFKKWDTSLATIKKEDAVNKEMLPTEIRITPWNMVRQLNEKGTGNVNILIFTPSQHKLFYGERPVTNSLIKFQFYTPADSTSRFINHAHNVNADSVALIIAESNGNINIVRHTIASLDGTDSTDLLLKQQNDGMYISFPNTLPLKVDDHKYRITIVSETGTTDAHAIEAAVNAVQQFTRYDVSVNVTTPDKLPTVEQEWIFWLTGKSLPPEFKTNNILQYAGIKTESVQSNIQLHENPINQSNFLLFRRYEFPNLNRGEDIVLWKDGWGDPLLISKKNAPNHYFFYSRFDPEWNNLTWHPAFPSLIFDLMFRSRYVPLPDSMDRRNIDTTQIIPGKLLTNTAIPALHDSFSLKGFCWWLVLFLFVTERLISTQPKKVRS